METFDQLTNERASLLAEWDTLERSNAPATAQARIAEIEERLAVVASGLERHERRRAWEREVPAVGKPATPVFAGGHDRAIDRPFASLGDQLQSVAMAAQPGATIDPRLYKAAVSGASEGVPSDGGYLVRTDYSTQLLDSAIEQAVIAPLCTPLEIGADSDSVELPYIDETSRATGSRWGGVQVYWRAEADTVTSKMPKFAELDVKLQELMGLAYATNRLLRDATALESIFTMAFSSEMAFKLDDSILRGNGAGQLLGIFDANGPRVRTTKTGTQGADTVVDQNISDMWKDVRTRSKGKGLWFFNSEVGPQLDQLAFAVGTAALPSRNVTYNEAGVLRIKGRPALELEQASAIGDEGDLFFADFSRYLLIKKGGIDAEQSMHVRFVYGEQCFRWTYRVNGRPMDRVALARYKGTGSVSPFVTLQAR